MEPVTQSLIQSLLSLMTVFALFAALIFFLMVVLPNFLGKGNGKPGQPIHYKKQKRLLSAAEASFHGVLRVALAEEYWIAAKVRLGDLLAPVERGKGYMAALNRINRKHVDFVLCDLKTSEPLLVIELDDKSHEREDRQQRDAFVDEALSSAGLPILHITAAKQYAPQAIAARVRGVLKQPSLLDDKRNERLKQRVQAAVQQQQQADKDASQSSKDQDYDPEMPIEQHPDYKYMPKTKQ